MDDGEARVIERVEANLPLVDTQYPGSSTTVTMSAVRSDRLEDLVTLFGEIAAYYADRPDKFQRFLDARLAEIQTYNDFNMDLHSLAGHLIRFEGDPTMADRLADLQNRIDQAVIAEIHGENVPGSRGVAIYFPTPGVSPFHPEDYTPLAFAAATRWDDILAAHCGTATGPSPGLPGLIDRLRETARMRGQRIFPH